ncbi:hypothetical protein HDK77DRAFT_497139 [Phyllosticta capitalensis]|uniref:Rhodopsin domain-containing protein n=1 Tax=Phyllosticta capitalensis TaxID=121624 RepID=A0ABR1YY71_9PEZI
MYKHYWSETLCTLILVFLIVGFRLGSRAKRIGVKMFEVDDYLMFAAALMMFTVDALYYWESHNNRGAATFQWAGPGSIPGYEPTPEYIDMMIKGSQVMLAYTFICIVLIWTTKLCMCMLYWRLMSQVDLLRLLAQIGFVVVGATFTVSFITVFAACQPSFSGYWQAPRPKNRECSVAYGVVVRVLPAVLNIVADLYLLVPVGVMTWRVQADRERKITLCVVFGVSLFLTIIAALRIGLPYAAPSGNLAFVNTQWGARECWVAIITTNVPVVFGELNKLGLSDWVRKRFGKPTPPADQDPEAGRAGINRPIIPRAAGGVPGHASNAPSPTVVIQISKEPRAPSSASHRSRFTENLNANERGFSSAKQSNVSRSTEEFELESLCSNDDRVVIPRESV